jgi:hypothetical protein
VGRLYQELDQSLCDYRLAKHAGHWLRGPSCDLSRPYLAAVGGAETLGRFVERPYPQQLAERLSLGCLNLGLPGMGPAAFLHEDVQRLLRGAALVVVSCLSGRSAPNDRFDNRARGGLFGTVGPAGQRLRFEQFLAELVQHGDAQEVRRLVTQTRRNFTAGMLRLGRALRGRAVLLWFSQRHAPVATDWSSAASILGPFPQLVDQAMLRSMRRAYAECVVQVGQEGLPQRLWPSQQTILGTQLHDGMLWNRYYPSQPMHDLAALALLPACRRALVRAASAPVAAQPW